MRRKEKRQKEKRRKEKTNCSKLPSDLCTVAAVPLSQMCVGCESRDKAGSSPEEGEVGAGGQLSGGDLVEHGRGSALPCQS